MYVRGTKVIVLRPGVRGSDHAGERFEQGGQCETDLLPIGEEIDHHRIVVPNDFPETVMQSLPGRRLGDVIEPPPFRGNCPIRGTDIAGDELHAIADLPIAAVRRVERGLMIIVNKA